MPQTEVLHFDANPMITGLKSGSGSIPCLIVGPASFYFSKLSNHLKEQFTFYAFDDLWAYSKDDSVNLDAIKEEDLESLIAKIQVFIHLLKERFSYTKVGLLGFSAPGLLAIAAALTIGHEDIAFVIGSGLCSTPLDPEFKASNAYFEKYAEPKRKTKFEENHQTFQALIKDRELSPQAYWGETIRSMVPKQLYDYENEEVIGQFVDEWALAPNGKIMCEAMRLHFFNEILPQIMPTQLMEKFIKMNPPIPFMLAYGKRDYTTPPPKKQVRNEWGQHSHFFFEKYDNSVHYPSWETSVSLFDCDVLNFVKKHNIELLSCHEELVPSEAEANWFTHN